jgi:tRNA threonylcarbamoyladenosine biosynthesis protein TsaE
MGYPSLVILDEKGLTEWGREFASTLQPPAVVALSGELGAGKTTLVRAVARALGVTESVTSPTFALVHRYRGDGLTIYHVDAYRIKPGDEGRDLGFEDMLADPRAIVFVEWPERLASPPPFTHRIALEHVTDSERRITPYPVPLTP